METLKNMKSEKAARYDKKKPERLKQMVEEDLTMLKEVLNTATKKRSDQKLGSGYYHGNIQQR